MNEVARQDSVNSRELLDLVIEARMEYTEYLRAVGVGEERLDPSKRECLKDRCRKTLEAWRETHHAWREANWFRTLRTHLPSRHR